MLQVNLNEINISFLECDNWLSYIFTIQGCRRWVGRVGNYPHPGFNRIGCCITIRLIQMQVQANLDLRTLIYSFLNRELFDLRKVYSLYVLDLKTGRPKKMSCISTEFRKEEVKKSVLCKQVNLQVEIFLKSRFNCTTGSFINSNVN